MDYQENETLPENESSAKPAKAITLKTWLAMGALAIVGQLAWAVENSWFNKFVTDMITPDPRPIAWMVAASAIVATLTTIFMGTWSDRSRSRWGRRKPFILIGYGLWGVMTAVFPLTALMKNISTAIVMVVLVDCIMTFFGSTANDAAFNAWTADITPSNKRGRVEGVLNFCLFVAQLISYTAAGMLIESKGYFVFFYALGGLVTVIGVIAASQIDEPSAETLPKPETTYWQDIRDLLDWRVLVENRKLFLLLLIITIAGIGFQVSFPYLIIYVTDTLEMPISSYMVIGGAMLVGSAVLAIPLGFLAEKINRKWLTLVSLLLSALGYFLFSTSTNLILLALYGLLWLGMNTAFAIVSMAWLKDLLPVESRGRFLGVRMIFAVMLPMIFGPMIGQALIRQFGTPTMLGAEAGFLPAPIIFVIGAIITVFAIIPLFFFDKRKTIDQTKA
jgi:MFS family permease